MFYVTFRCRVSRRHTTVFFRVNVKPGLSEAGDVLHSRKKDGGWAPGEMSCGAGGLVPAPASGLEAWAGRLGLFTSPLDSLIFAVQPCPVPGQTYSPTPCLDRQAGRLDSCRWMDGRWMAGWMAGWMSGQVGG